MRELLKAAETVVDEYKGVPSSHFHSLLVKLEEAIAAAKERSKWHKIADGLPVVPVPEWVPVGERLPVVPEGESMINVWYAYKDFVGACPISRDGAWSLPSHATHWQHNYEPAPPKSEPL